VELLQEFDVEAAAAVRGAAVLKEADWKELLRQEGLDPAMKRRAYIKHASHRLLVHDVHWQFTAFAQVAPGPCWQCRNGRLSTLYTNDICDDVGVSSCGEMTAGGGDKVSSGRALLERGVGKGGGW